MPNSRSSFRAKKDITTGQNVTFTPTREVNTWQFRFLTGDNGDESVSVQTKDEDGDFVHVDGSPFTAAAPDAFDANGNLEVTVDSSNPSIKVSFTGTGTCTAKCKAYRSLDDMTGGGYDTLT